MTAQQRIVRVRRNYNQWVANQTLEDYALRFTAKSARKWSSFAVANTAIGAVSFLALEAIGGSITVNYGFINATSAILVVGALIFLTSVPIAYYAATYGVDIDLLTRGAGFGYIGSTITSLIYASFTFLFFAIEAAIMSLALEMCFGIPLFAGYVLSSLIVIPLVTHGITFISRLQLWTQPVWIVLHLIPFVFIAFADLNSFERWTGFSGIGGVDGRSFNLVLFGTAATVVFSLIAQIGEQVDFLRFLPPPGSRGRLSWWTAYLSAGPGWIVPGVLKMLAGSFLAFLAIEHLVPPQSAAEPTQMYLVGFGYVFSSPQLALAFTGAFVIISQIKINVTNAYAGSIAWSNFFSRLTHSHPGRVVWLVFNVTIALMLMELGIFKMLEHILGLYSIVAVAWVGALVADLAINKPLGLSPAGIEFKRAHLYDINPVGVGAMLAATVAGIVAFFGVLGTTLQSLSAFLALAVAFIMAPAIAYVTKSRFYIARAPRQNWSGHALIRCAICEHPFETEDMAHCPAYSGPICSLCCSLETRCRDCCKPQARISTQVLGVVNQILPDWIARPLNTDIGRYLGVLLLFGGVIGSVLSLVYFQVSLDSDAPKAVLKSTLWTVFFILTIIAGVAAWLFVLGRGGEPPADRSVDERDRGPQAHRRQAAEGQGARGSGEQRQEPSRRGLKPRVAHAAQCHPWLLAIAGTRPGASVAAGRRRQGRAPERGAPVGADRRAARHIEDRSGTLSPQPQRGAHRGFPRAAGGHVQSAETAKGVEFRYIPSKHLPVVVHTDENRLRQILINLLSNAIKFTDVGHVVFRVDYRYQLAQFTIEDTGVGIHRSDLERIFLPFERARTARAKATVGTGLGLTITKLLTNVMGGDLTVKSEVDKGSSFRVKLLLSEVSRPRIASTKEDRVRGYVGPRQTILVVDDNEIQRGLARDLLAPLGFEILTAATGMECLALADRHKPNLILLDVAMPEMDGWEVARRLRQASREPTAIVILSANAIDPSRLLEGERLHDDYVMKPIDLRQLLKKVHALLNIEWTYEPEPESKPAPAIASGPFAVPAGSDLDELIGLGEIGHVRKILEKLREIEQSAPECGDFVVHMRTIVNAFDLRRYAAALEAIRSNHA
jgi:CheY-like chemotaxis protein